MEQNGTLIGRVFKLYGWSAVQVECVYGVAEDVYCYVEVDVCGTMQWKRTIG